MCKTINELLKENDYNIYQNENINDEKLEEIAKWFSKNDNVELLEYLSLVKCVSKFCWRNFILIIEKMEEPQKSKGLPLLFELLQDANWPVFDLSITTLMSFGREKVVPYLEEYLVQAYEDEDEMWIFGIQMLVQKMNIEPKDFNNKDVVKILESLNY